MDTRVVGLRLKGLLGIIVVVVIVVIVVFVVVVAFVIVIVDVVVVVVVVVDVVVFSFLHSPADSSATTASILQWCQPSFPDDNKLIEFEKGLETSMLVERMAVDIEDIGR